jgi:hypothetical protein
VDIVDGMTPSETEEEPPRRFSVRGTGKMGTQDTLDNFVPTVGKEKLGMIVTHLDLLAT